MLPLRSNSARAVRAEVPVAVLPAHRRRVERGQQRHPRPGAGHRLDVVGQHQPGRAAVEVDLDRHRARRARRGCGPIVQPVHHFRSATGAGPERGAATAAPARPARHRCRAPAGRPASHADTGAQRYCVLVQRAEGAAAHDATLGREQEQQGAARHVLRRVVGRNGERVRSRGSSADELRRRRLAAACQQRSTWTPSTSASHARRLVGHPDRLDVLDEPAALHGGDVERVDAACTHRREVERHHEHRPPHRRASARVRARRAAPARPSATSAPRAGRGRPARRSRGRWRAARRARRPRRPHRRPPSPARRLRERGDGAARAVPVAPPYRSSPCQG